MRVLTFSSVVLVLAGCGGQYVSETSTKGESAASTVAPARRSWQPDATADQPISAASATLWVKGLSCPLCANNIDKQLKRVSGVDNVRVDLGEGKVNVKLADAGRPTRRELAKAVEQSGFTLDRIETP